MTILPKEAAASRRGPANEPPPRTAAPAPAPRRGVGVGSGPAWCGRGGRGRDSGVDGGPSRARHRLKALFQGHRVRFTRWALAVPPGAVAGPRPQQASPPPCAGAPEVGGPGDALGTAAAGRGRGGCGGGRGQCRGCGRLLLRAGSQQAAASGPRGWCGWRGQSWRERVGAGYNSEDEYGTAAGV